MQISKRNIKIFYITEFLHALMFYVPVWVAFELQYISLAELAIIEAIIQASQLLSELPTGAIADLLGKKTSVIIGRIIGILAILLYARSTSFHSFVLYAVITGFGESFVSGAEDALIYDSLKQDGLESRYQKIKSKGSFIFQLSFAAAILLGGFISLWGYTLTIYLTIIPYFIASVMTFFLIEPSIDTLKFTIPRYIRQLKMGFHELFKSPYVRDISLFYIAVGGITWSAMMIFNTSLLTTIGYTTFEIGLIIAFIRLFNSSVLFGSLHIKDLLTKRRTYVLFPIIMLICYLPGVLLTKTLAIVAVTGSIFASTARWVVLGGYVNEQYESKHRATALSTLSMLISISVVGFALISSPVMGYLGGVRSMFTVLGVATILTVLPLGLRIRRRYHS